MRTHTPSSLRTALAAVLAGLVLAMAAGCGPDTAPEAGPNATAPAVRSVAAGETAPRPAPTAFDANRTAVLAALDGCLEDNDLVRAERLLDTWRPTAKADERFSALAARFDRAERHAREYALRTELENTSSRHVEKRLELYRRLLEIVPGNAEYTKQLERYETRLAKKNHTVVADYFKNTLRTKTQHDAMLRLMRRALEIEPDNKAYRATMRRLAYDGLRFPEGDSTAEMAVDDEGVQSGRRTLYVWVYNVGDTPLDAAPERFALGLANATLAPMECALAPKQIEPGHKAEGRLVFDTAEPPRALRFATSDETGVARLFPAP